jgi:Eco57I restriction-modification methylase
VFVTPSRWMAGGKGLDKYRGRMLSDRRMRSIVDYPKLSRDFRG